MQQSRLKTCPYCLCEKLSTEFNKEHVIPKALYKVKGKDECARPAIIDVCKICNSKKSVFDNEILALYGHPSDFKKAQKAQQSLKDLSEKISTKDNEIVINDTISFDDLLLVSARMQTHGGKGFLEIGGNLVDIASRWTMYASVGIYNFLRRDVFEGFLEPTPPRLMRVALTLDEYTKIHRITENCTISLTNINSEERFLATLQFKTPDGKPGTLFSCYMYKTREQLEKSLAERLNIENPGNLLEQLGDIAEPRQIYAIRRTVEGDSYQGIKRLKDKL